MSQDLPAGLAEPLHILEPAAEGSFLPWLVALALAAALLAWWIRRRARRTAPVASASTLRTVAAGGGVAGRIWAVRSKYLDRRDRRQGCHELAAVLRDHLEPRVPVTVSAAGPGGDRAWRRRPPLSVLTAREIGSLLGDGALGRFLVLLAGHQFGRLEPERKTFMDLCDLAVEAVREAPGERP